MDAGSTDSVNPATRDALRAARAVAGAMERHRKVPLLMAEAERRRLMALLLRIHEQAMATFDCLEADAVSEHDCSVMAQLPEYVNEFTKAMQAHAQARIDALP